MDADRLRLEELLQSARQIERRLRLSVEGDRLIIERFINQLPRPGSDDELRAVDAFIQRYEQLLEIMLRRIFPAIVRFQGRAYATLTLVETLEYLQADGYVPEAAAWQRRKELRDRLVHEYPMEPTDQASDLRAAIAESRALLGDLETVRAALSLLQFKDKSLDG